MQLDPPPPTFAGSAGLPIVPSATGDHPVGSWCCSAVGHGNPGQGGDLGAALPHTLSPQMVSAGDILCCRPLHATDAGGHALHSRRFRGMLWQ